MLSLAACEYQTDHNSAPREYKSTLNGGPVDTNTNKLSIKSFETTSTSVIVILDEETGCQYFIYKYYDAGGMISRLDKDGNPYGCGDGVE